jgi:hypothetical protein
MAHSSTVVHHIPGRVRLRIAEARHNSRLIDKVKTSVADMKGVSSVHGSPTTGCLLINYARETYSDLAELFSAMRNSTDLASLLELPVEFEMQPEVQAVMGISALAAWLTGRNNLALVLTAAVVGLMIVTDTWPIGLTELYG